MPMPAVEFTTQALTANALSSRADVAMFVGLVARREGDLPESLVARLEADGWSADGIFKISEDRRDKLLGIPVAVYSWAEFDALFDWRSRPADKGFANLLPCPLGLSVQQFFRQGGAKAYIVRTGDPVPLADTDASAESFLGSKLAAISNADAPSPDALPILPGYDGLGKAADPLDPATWIGAAAIFAVPDAAMLLLPDIVDLCSGAPIVDPQRDGPLGQEENFRPCAPAAPQLEVEPRMARPSYLAPRLDVDGFRRWSSALRFANNLLSRPKGPTHRRDVILVSAMPLPAHIPELGNANEFRPLELLVHPALGGREQASSSAPIFSEHILGSRHLQLGYPWLSTAEAQSCPEGLQSPDGALAGMIARSSLSDGAFRSAAGRGLYGSVGLFPALAGSDIAQSIAKNSDWLGERLCLFAMRAGELELISDATMAEDTSWRAGGISRLMGVILRASRYLGDDLLFEPSGSALWNRLRTSMERLLEQLRRLGAFTGASQDEAYTVRCDRNTMTQSDIDAGRVICQISFSPAHPIQRITVTLALRDAPAKLAEAA